MIIATLVGIQGETRPVRRIKIEYHTDEPYGSQDQHTVNLGLTGAFLVVGFFVVVVLLDVFRTR